MQIRPLHDRVIVKRLEVERTTASGIVIPDNAGEKIRVKWSPWARVSAMKPASFCRWM